MDGMSSFGAAWAETADATASGQTRQEPIWQTTLGGSICCEGTGLHSGRRVRLTLHPADADTGYVFVRSDLGGAVIPAGYDRVTDTRLCTLLSNGEAQIGTVEHLLAALAGTGIDNARIEVDGPELPILDGSAEPFLFLIDCAGVTRLAAPRRRIEVLRPVRVANGPAWAALRPYSGTEGEGFDMTLSIDFAAPAIGRQDYALSLTAAQFRHELAASRTFTLAEEVAKLREAGLGLGGSLDNAIVVDGARVLNQGGLRMPDEFVRHKLLDAVGDLALAGHRLRGRFSAHRTGHALNNLLLHALFADRANWRLVIDMPGGLRKAA